MKTVHVIVPTPATIFLCGGDISPPDDQIKSLRKAFLRFAYDKPFDKYRILIAEDLNAFFPKGTYKDLLSLESDLAQVASLIVVFSESYGSAAELGAFAMKSEIAQRLLVIIDDKNYRADSFIKLGPILSLEVNICRASVYVIYCSDLKIRSINELSGLDYSYFKIAMLEALTEREKTIETRSTFHPDNHGHQIMLMTGIVQQHGALTLAELQQCLGNLGFYFTKENISNLMLCAEFVEWIDKIPKGSFDYYVCKLKNQVITFRKNKKFSSIDFVRWRSDVLAHWQVTDPSRFSIITKARASA